MSSRFHSIVAGGLINMTQQVGGAIGLAIIAAVATGAIHTAAPTATAVDHGFQHALVVAAVIAALAGLVTTVVLPGRRERRTLTEPTAVAEVAGA